MTSRRWFPYAITVGVYIVVGLVAWLFFDDTFRHQWERRSLSREERTYLRLESLVRAENEAFREIVLRDSIAPLIPSRPGVFTLLPADSTKPGYLEQLLLREVGARPKAAVGLVGALPFYGSHPALKQAWSRTVYLSGSIGALPYCVAVLPTLHNAVQRNFGRVVGRGMQVLGPCVFWGRYGAPGPHIARWLADNGARFARAPDALRPGDTEWNRPHGLLERTLMPRWYASLRGQACLAGKLDICEQAVLHDDSTMSDRNLVFASRSWRTRLFSGEAYLLGSLQEQFGRARFEAFWTSSRPVAVAFEEAFGMPLGQWVHEWTSGVLRPLSAGASMGAGTILLSILLLGILAGTTAAIAARRAL